MSQEKEARSLDFDNFEDFRRTQEPGYPRGGEIIRALESKIRILRARLRGVRPDPVVTEIPSELSDISAILHEAPVPEQYPPCVYFLLKRGRVVYVGQSISLMPRLADHAKTKDFDRVLYVGVPQGFALHIEAAYIHHIRPRYNGVQSIKSVSLARAKVLLGVSND